MSKQTKTAIGIRMVKNELERFFANHKTYPLAPASHSIAEASVTIGSQTYIMSSYITASTLDLYAPDGSQSYRYFLNGANGYILVSNGPDYDIDITAEVLPPVDSKERSTILSSLKYDPSNGVLSDGDIFQTGP